MGTSRCSRAAAAAALVLPWAVAPGLRDWAYLPKGLLAAAAAAFGALAWAAAGRPPLALGLEAPLAACLAVAGAAAFLSGDPLAGVHGPSYEHAASLSGLAAAAAGLYLGAAAARGKDDPSLVPAALVAGSVPVSCLAVLQMALPIPFFFLRADPTGRATGTFGHPVALGAYLTLVIPAALSLALAARGTRARTAWAAAAGLGTAALAASGTRAAWLGAAFGCAAVLWAQARPAARRLAVVTAGLGLAAAVLITFRVRATERLDGGRLEAWRLAGTAALERPWLGHGPGTFSRAFRRLRTETLMEREGPHAFYRDAHNDWIEVLFAAGLAGALAYAWLHAAAFAALRRGQGPAMSPAVGAAVGLLFFAKANLPGVPAVFLAALLVGAALGAGPAVRGRAAAAALFLCAAGWTGWSALRRVPAERAALLGRLARREGLPQEAARHLERAVSLNPEVLAFRMDLLNLLWDVAPAVATAERGPILDRARDVALDGVVTSPSETEYLWLLGMAEARRARWAGEDSEGAAGAVLEAARALDPLDRRARGGFDALAEPWRRPE